MAEHHPETLSPTPSKTPLTLAHALRFDLELVKQHLDILIIEGAEQCFPATVARAKIRQNRIQRELSSNMPTEGSNDLIIQRSAIAALERRLDYVKRESKCKPKINGSKSIDINNLSNLLNIDNQFSFDSSELSPKYIGNLAKAAELLRTLTSYQLQISGHTDSLGTDSHNKNLSTMRAKKVSRYLQIFGVDKSRLTISSLGSKKPYYDSKLPQNRLVNRRVTITLIDNNLIK